MPIEHNTHCVTKDCVNASGIEIETNTDVDHLLV